MPALLLRHPKVHPSPKKQWAGKGWENPILGRCEKTMGAVYRPAGEGGCGEGLVTQDLRVGRGE